MKDILNKLLDLLKLIWTGRNQEKVYASRLLRFSTVMITLGLGGKALELRYQGFTISLLEHDTSLSTIIVCAGVLAFIASLFIFFRSEKKASSEKKVLILHSGISKLKEGDARKGEGNVEILPLDHTPYLDNGLIIDPKRCLRDILQLNGQLLAKTNGFEGELVYCGLSQVPFAFAVGREVSNKQSIRIKDWDRNKKEWYDLREADDQKDEFLIPKGLDIKKNDLILKLSVSYSIDSEAVAQLNISGIECDIKVENIERANLDSEEKQIRLAESFHKILDLAQRENVSTVHIFCAAQASFCFRLGTQISKTLHPPIMVYQFEKNSHPWAIKLESGNDPQVIELKGE